MTQLAIFPYIFNSSIIKKNPPPCPPPHHPSLLLPTSTPPARHDSTLTFQSSVSLQTLLSSLFKLDRVSEFSCTEDGTFPHPLDCSKNYHCDTELKMDEYVCLYPLTCLLFNIA